MKIQIKLTVPSNKEEGATLRLKVNEADSCSIVKERVASVHPMPFSEQDLMFNGEVMSDEKKLADFGVKEGSQLELVVKASEQVFLSQLTDLLQQRDLPSEELAMLYCYKHGASLNVALRAIGFQGKLEDFLQLQKKGIALENGRVALVREDTKMKPFSILDEIVEVLKANGGSLEMKQLCERFTEKFNVSLASVTGVRVSDFLAKQKSLFSISGKVVSLAGCASSHTSSSSPPRSPPRSPPKSPPSRAQTPPGLAQTPPGLAPAPAFSPGDQIRPPPGLEEARSVSPPLRELSMDAKYQELHEKLAGRAFQSKIMNVLSILIDMLLDVVFVNIENVVKGGSIGNGTAVSGGADAELVLVVSDVPVDTFHKRAPALAKSLVDTLLAGVADEEITFNSITAAADAVQVQIAGKEEVRVSLRFAPAFESHDATVRYLMAVRWFSAEVRQCLAPAFAKEKLQFVSRQPGQVKVTIRLLKWWRNQQSWKSETAKPKDDLLEVLTVFSANQNQNQPEPPADTEAAVASVLALMGNFKELSIIWTTHYAKEDICPKLLKASPLVMDPVNPFVNLAASDSFEPDQMMALASTASLV